MVICRGVSVIQFQSIVTFVAHKSNYVSHLNGPDPGRTDGVIRVSNFWRRFWRSWWGRRWPNAPESSFPCKTRLNNVGFMSLRWVSVFSFFGFPMWSISQDADNYVSARMVFDQIINHVNYVIFDALSESVTGTARRRHLLGQSGHFVLVRWKSAFHQRYDSQLHPDN